jgi:hypothetical protein
VRHGRDDPPPVGDSARREAEHEAGQETGAEPQTGTEAGQGPLAPAASKDPGDAADGDSWVPL